MSKPNKRVIKTFAELHAEFSKNSIGGDVHVPSAGGDDKPRKKEDLTSVSKGDGWSLPVEITKADLEKQQVFGWASIAMVDGHYVVDKHDDVITV